MKDLSLEFKVDSITTMNCIENETIDLIVSNYVLQDTPYVEDAIHCMFQKLKKGGRVVLVFLHPCFSTKISKEHNTRIYEWSKSYFEHFKTETAWGSNHFLSGPFLEYHRPLSFYWKAFLENGFRVIGFEEPILLSKRHGEIACSIVFHLLKPS